MVLIFVTALAWAVLFFAIGLALKSLMWTDSEPPKTATDYGRKFGSYFLFIASVISSHNFIQKEFDEAVVAALATIVMFTLLGFVIGFFYKHFMLNRVVPDRGKPTINPNLQSTIFNPDGVKTHSLAIEVAYKNIHKSKMNIPVDIDEETIWIEVLAELEGGNRKPGIWAKAFSESDGDDSKTKALYLRIRFDDIYRSKAAEEASIAISTEKMYMKPSKKLVTVGETREEQRALLLNAMRKSFCYEDALAVLKNSGFEVRINPCGFFNSVEYEVWELEMDIMVFKAISKGLIYQFVKEKFSDELSCMQ